MGRIALPRVHVTVLPVKSGLKVSVPRSLPLHSHRPTPIFTAIPSHGARGGPRFRRPLQIQPLGIGLQAGGLAKGKSASRKNWPQGKQPVSREGSSAMSGGEVLTENSSANGDNNNASPSGNENGASGSGSTGATVYQYAAVGEKWREIAGANNWAGLLNPLDLLLRSELLRYGEYAQATYDTFDNDANTKLAGSNRFAKHRLLEKAQILRSGYEVTDYIYATAGLNTPKAIFNLVTKQDVNQLGADQVWSLQTNWIGYVAVLTDPVQIKRLGRRDILVAWRGTNKKIEWVADFTDVLVPSALDPRRKGQASTDLKIEKGFLNLYTASNPKSSYIPSQSSARLQMLKAVGRLVEQYGQEELSITVTGHSLGAALATISGYDIAESSINQPDHLPKDLQKWNDLEPRADPDDVVEWTESPTVKTVPVTVFTFAGPRVGNDAFRDRVEQLQVKVLRVVNKNDLVPKAPGLFVNEKSTWLNGLLNPVRKGIDKLPWTYSHVGELIEIDNTASPFLVSTKDVFQVHNLEACYLHVLSGWQGEGKPFEQVVTRDLALVNKGSSLLLPKYFMPQSWWGYQFRGLVRVETNGKWVTYVREEEDYPEHFDPSTMQTEARDEAAPDSELTASAAATPVTATPATDK